MLRILVLVFGTWKKLILAGNKHGNKMSTVGAAAWHWRGLHRPSLETFLHTGHHLLALTATPWRFCKGIHPCLLRIWEKSKSNMVSWGRQPRLGEKGAGARRAATVRAGLFCGRRQRKTGWGSWVWKKMGLGSWAARCEGRAAWGWGPGTRGYSTAAGPASRHPCQQSMPQLLKIKHVNSEIYGTELTLESLIHFWNWIFLQKSTYLNHLRKGLWICPQTTITMNSKSSKHHADFTRLIHKDYKQQHSIICVGNRNI